VNLFDVIVLLLAVAAGIGGWRFGFVTRVLAWCGVALGLLIGIGVPLIGVLAAVGLTLFFIAALIMHVRAHDLSLGYGVPVIFLVVVVAALVLGIYGRGHAM